MNLGKLSSILIDIMSRFNPLIILLLILSLINLTKSAPSLSNIYSNYIYSHRASLISSNSGFEIKSKVNLEIIYILNNNNNNNDNNISLDDKKSLSWLVKLKLDQPSFYQHIDGSTISESNLNTNPLIINGKLNDIFNSKYYLLAHILNTSNGSAQVKEVYTHKYDKTTFKNLKKSILLNLINTPHHKGELLTYQSNSEPNLSEHKLSCIDDNNQAQPELFSPDSISRVYIKAKKREPKSGLTTTLSSISKDNIIPITIFESVEGSQNVTFRSRVFAQAESNLTTEFNLNLIDVTESNTHEHLSKCESIAQAIKLTLEDGQYQADTIDLQRERSICSHHHCESSLAQLYQDYRESMTKESMASVDSAVAFLRILDHLRQSKGTSVNDILSILKKMKGNYGVQSSFLDILAAARTKDSIAAALKHIKLPKNTNLDTSERFLSVLSVAAKTASKMHLRRPIQSPYYLNESPALKKSSEARSQMSNIASLEFIAKELLNILETSPADKWSSQKLRWSTLLTLATVLNANHQEHHYENVEDEFSEKVSNLLLNELEACSTDTDCRIVILQAIGNVGHLGDRQFEAIEEYALSSGRRESICAMKILRDLLSHQPRDQKRSQAFYSRLKELLMHVVYDNTKETTARVLAAELIVRFIPNSLAPEQLLNHLPSFGNNELATMIYSRMESLMPPDSLAAKHRENWYWKSCIINGTSASFVRTMAKTESLNASYGVNVELLNRRKLLKESSFDVFLDTKERTQDLFSLGIFARGLSKFAGSDSSGGEGDSAEDKNESMMAGMTLRLLGGYLRPYVFFSGYSELIGHVMAGTASEPTTAFNGDLLLIDHEEGYPLISGFVAEQQMRGVLSIDVTGKVELSLWYKKSKSVVRTKAAVIVQASQSVFTAYDNFWLSNLFSFGGQALIDFKADSAFDSTPVKICLQVTQPEFLIRFNLRRRDQMMTNEVRRKLTRKNYSISAKSYPLNSENNKMCSEMNAE